MEFSRQPLVRLTCWTACLALTLLSGCAGNGPPPQDPGGSFDQIQRTVFDQHCLSAGCHNAQSQAGALNLASGASYDQLVNVTPNNPVAQGSGLLRVQPLDPSNSFLLVKLTNPGTGEGTRMPQGMDPLSPSDIANIQQWILAGAPRTGTKGPTPTATAVPPSPTATPPPPPSPTATVTPTPADTGTATPTVTGTPPPTSTATVTPTVTATESPSPTPTVTPTLSAFGVIQTTIFNTTCVDAFCHDAEGMSGGLVLVEGQSYANLVGVTPQNLSARNAGLLRVDAGNPANSFLLVKVGNPPLIQGGRMPLGKLALSAAQIALINDWIAAGASQ
jgi:cytochrome c553